MMQELRWLLETIALALSAVLVLVTMGLARRLGRLDTAGVSVQLFLHAARIRRFLVAFALASLLFVAMPLSILGYLWSDDDALEVIHDASHLLFLVTALVGFWGLHRLAQRQG